VVFHPDADVLHKAELVRNGNVLGDLPSVLSRGVVGGEGGDAVAVRPDPLGAVDVVDVSVMSGSKVIKARMRGVPVSEEVREEGREVRDEELAGKEHARKDYLSGMAWVNIS
jgi:hypothetical protein